ncbi:LysR family transcriptional regulator [Paludibacterium paludis]|uniref:LysR family transcriptional regulator n=1 Tax=Paludibacterium paludis TaxID=1225769 RepID=A0A918UAU0_9NEIS|nr:LysR family transcriptional regulator [Paludibacterium paludis]GGY24709.1 LysR family transcriptional regulator [Paludibacterium paludis]
MTSPDPFRGIAVFLRVVEAGSFTRAAERLDMSKSGVAKSIGRLEDGLGVRLFQRTTRRLSLTDEGLRFREGCLRALSELEDAQAQLTNRRRELAGRLRIDLPVVFGRRWVMPALLEIAARHPSLELDISLSDRRSDLVEDGIDLVIRIGPLVDSATQVARPLGVQRAVLVADPGYLARHGWPGAPEDLHGHACITFGGGGQARPWHLLDEYGHGQALNVRGRLGLNHSEAILDAVLAGQGIALLSDWLVAEHLRTGRLERVLPAVRTQGFPIHAVWLKNRHLSARVRHVVDLLAERFVPHAPWEPPAP